MKAKPRAKRSRVVEPPPEYEEWKAARRNLTHDDAVQVSVFLEKQYRRMWSDGMAASPVNLYQIVRTLTEKRIPFVLTGTHGIGAWTGRPRATYDVDILVKSGRNLVRAVNAIKALYPQLEVRVFFGVTGFFIPGETQSVIDVTYPHRTDLQETLGNPTWTENQEERLRYRVPRLEEALANKYGAMLTLSRRLDKRLIDAADFTVMVQHSMDEGREPIVLERLATLGEMVWPGGGGKEILHMVDQVKAGQAIHIDVLGKRK